jgi:ABC-type siderophore export system fused ATPase/permease subunit
MFNFRQKEKNLFLHKQIQHEHHNNKKKFNMVAFNSKANTWQNRMVEVTEQSLIGAWKWIQNLSCWGSTNTYAVIT